MIQLVPELIYRLRSVGPLRQTDGSPTGVRQYWQMSDAELEGPRIRARAPYPGGDWMRVGPDGFGRPDVRVQFVTDDDEVVLLYYTGLVLATDAFNRAAESNGSTDFTDQTMRMSLSAARQRSDRVPAPHSKWFNMSFLYCDRHYDLHSYSGVFAVYCRCPTGVLLPCAFQRAS